MLLRISLGLAILVGIATLYFSHSVVAPKIQNLTDTNARLEKEKADALAAETKARGEAKVARNDLDKTKKDLSDKVTALEAETTRRTEQEKRANGLAENLTKTTEERNDAQRELASWKMLSLPIDQIRRQHEDLVKANNERDAFSEENKVLLRKSRQLQADLDKLIGTDVDVEPKMPAGTKGQVVAVDPKFDFVILNIGGNQGVVENGRLLVNRNGKLVAKVRVTNVEPNRSVANVLPEWKQAGEEIMEGDQVLY